MSTDDIGQDVSVSDHEVAERRTSRITTALVVFLYAAVPVAVLIFTLRIHKSRVSSGESSAITKSDDANSTPPRQLPLPNASAPSSSYSSIDISLRRASLQLAISQAEQSIAHLHAAQKDCQELFDQTLHDEVGKRIAADEQSLLRFISLQSLPPPEHASPELHAVLSQIRDRASAESPRFDVLTNAASELGEIALTAFAFHEARLSALETLRANAASSTPSSVDLAAKLHNRSEELAQQQEHAAAEAAEQLKEQLQKEQLELSQQLASSRDRVSRLVRQLEQVRNGQFIDESSADESLESPLASREDYRSESNRIRTLLKPFITPGYVQPESADELVYERTKQPISYSDLKRIGALEATDRGIEILFRVGGSKSSSHQNDRPLGSFPRMNSRMELQKSHVASTLREAQRLLRTYGPYLVEDGLLAP